MLVCAGEQIEQCLRPKTHCWCVPVDAPSRRVRLALSIAYYLNQRCGFAEVESLVDPERFAKRGDVLVVLDILCGLGR
jgi:hypothetical protein